MTLSNHSTKESESGDKSQKWYANVAVFTLEPDSTLLTSVQSIEHSTPILVVGGGPAGLLTALQLARHGVNCMMVERNQDTTKWPKMDITNSRSMELLRRLGVAEGLRKIGESQTRL